MAAMRCAGCDPSRCVRAEGASEKKVAGPARPRQQQQQRPGKQPAQHARRERVPQGTLEMGAAPKAGLRIKKVMRCWTLSKASTRRKWVTSIRVRPLPCTMALQSSLHRRAKDHTRTGDIFGRESVSMRAAVVLLAAPATTAGVARDARWNVVAAADDMDAGPPWPTRGKAATANGCRRVRLPTRSPSDFAIPAAVLPLQPTSSAFGAIASRLEHTAWVDAWNPSWALLHICWPLDEGFSGLNVTTCPPRPCGSDRE
ncbi:hypothetical protein PSPO01_08135 [Paraphaeosphaeria sporulosa]